jgi:predicted nuclease of restriction endonuclease-like (RecB) superfamily
MSISVSSLSRKPTELAEQELRALRDEDRLIPDLVFRDPYVLDFLGLHDSYSERELEAAILREIESFLLELGVPLYSEPKRTLSSDRPNLSAFGTQGVQH